MSSVSAPKFWLTVNGQDYAGWNSARIIRSMRSVCGTFELSVGDRWSRSAPWPIAEEDQCQLSIDGKGPVLTGWVDRRRMRSSADSHSITVTGRDAPGALVDCSCELGKYEYKGIDLETFARRICKPFGIDARFELQGFLTALPPPPERFSIDPGDTAFEVLAHACRLAGVLPISDGLGGLLLMRPGSERATTSLVDGENIKEITTETDASGRFGKYIVRGQHPGSETWSGAAANQVKGEAIDETVKRPGRVLVIRPSGALTPALAKTRAQWEATVRAARSKTITVTVQGWQQEDGSLWPINAAVPVKVPRAGIDGDMLIVQASHGVDPEGGSTTELSLERPDAYLPEPVITKATELWFNSWGKGK